jgi:hypothetical protein
VYQTSEKYFQFFRQRFSPIPAIRETLLVDYPYKHSDSRASKGVYDCFPGLSLNKTVGDGVMIRTVSIIIMVVSFYRHRKKN